MAAQSLIIEVGRDRLRLRLYWNIAGFAACARTRIDQRRIPHEEITPKRPILRVRFGFGLKLSCTDSTSILSALRGIVHAECAKEQQNP